MTSVVLQNCVIKLGDLLAARPVPKLKDGSNQSDARHFGCKAIVSEQIERGGMGRGGAWIRLRAIVDVK
jgi:hypothetical protein